LPRSALNKTQGVFVGHVEGIPVLILDEAAVADSEDPIEDGDVAVPFVG
jgi:hypothetical protein